MSSLSIGPAYGPESGAMAGAQYSAADAAVVIFGASGDLTARKLVPALFELWRSGYLSDRSPIVGAARREKSDEEFRAEMHEAVSRFGRAGPVTDDVWKKFAARLYYRQ